MWPLINQYRDMKEFFAIEYYGNTLQQWGTSLLIILGAIIIGKMMYWFFGNVVKKLISKTKTKLDDILVDMLEEPLVFAFSIAGIWLSVHRLNLSEAVFDWTNQVFHVLIAINITWLLARLVDSLIQEYFVPLTEKSESDLDDQLLPIVRKGIRFIIWVLGIVVALNNAGYDVGALIAGLGIGGLALAMAAKDTVSNFFGGMTVYTDQPFKVGERIKIGGFDGTITEIGMRSTRLTTSEGRMVTIPNSKFSDGMVENVSREPSRKIVLNLGLTYDTNADNIELAMRLLKEIAANEGTIEEDVKLSFNNFGDFSLGILMIYYIKKGEDTLLTQTNMNLAILRKFEENKLEFAFPSQTIYAEVKNA